MSVHGFELGDKVKLKESTDGFTKGFSGRVTSLVYIKGMEKNIGVNLDVSGLCPTPYFFRANDLEKV